MQSSILWVPWVRYIPWNRNPLVNDESKENGYTKVFIAVAIYDYRSCFTSDYHSREKLSEQIAKEYPSELVEEEVIET